MIPRPLNDITQLDINWLIDNKIQEGKSFDFKETLTLSKEKEKGEFLADITSFANTIGGDLIIGIKEEEAIATEIKPIVVEDRDGEKLRIENLVRDSISPKITVEPRFIEIDSVGYVLVIRVPKSWNAPNRVIYNAFSKTKDQFYARNSSGKYQMDVFELRSSFNLATDLEYKVRDFKNFRISEISSDNTPINLRKGAKTILHIIPLSAFSYQRQIPPENLKKAGKTLVPICNIGNQFRLNLDGVLSYHCIRQNLGLGYSQLFRNGIIEAVDSYMLRGKSQTLDEGEKLVYSKTFEEEIRKAVINYTAVLHQLEIAPPWLVFITLIGVMDFKLGVGNHHIRFEEFAFEKDVLSLSEQMVQSYGEEVDKYLKPIFDQFWNAFGYLGSDNFDSKGNWMA